MRSHEISFTVKAIPGNQALDYWLVAKNIFLRESWNKSLTHVKVGDVLERTDRIDAKGTLPQFIPDIPVADPDWASVYPRDPVLKDERNDYDANGLREQKTLYLLEKEGAFTFPAFTVSWWNPQQQRMFSRTTKAVKVNVAANPDLGMLKTLRDSLSAKPATQKAKDSGPKTIWGIIWYRFLVLMVVVLFGIYLLCILGMKLLRYSQAKIQAWRMSEGYWFREFQHSDADPRLLINNFYQWWNSNKTSPDPYVKDKLKSGPSAVLHEWQETEKSFYGPATKNPDAALLKKQVALYRLQQQEMNEANGKLNAVQSEWPI